MMKKIFLILFLSVSVQNAYANTNGCNDDGICLEQNTDYRIISNKTDIINGEDIVKIKDKEKRKQILNTDRYLHDEKKYLDELSSEITSNTIYKNLTFFICVNFVVILLYLLRNKPILTVNKNKGIVYVLTLIGIGTSIFILQDFNSENNKNNGKGTNYLYDAYDDQFFKVSNKIYDIVLNAISYKKIDLQVEKNLNEKIDKEQKNEVKKIKSDIELFNKSIFDGVLTEIKTNQTKSSLKGEINTKSDLLKKLSTTNKNDIDVKYTLLHDTRIIKSIRINDYSVVEYEKIDLPEIVKNKISFKKFVELSKSDTGYKIAFDDIQKQLLNVYDNEKSPQYVKILNGLNLTCSKIYKRYRILDYVESNLSLFNEIGIKTIDSYCLNKPQAVENALKILNNENIINLPTDFSCLISNKDKLKALGSLNNKVLLKDYNDKEIKSQLNLNKEVINNIILKLNSKLSKLNEKIINDFIEIEQNYLLSTKETEELKKAGIFTVNKALKSYVLQERSYLESIIILEPFDNDTTEYYVYFNDKKENKYLDSYNALIDKGFNVQFVNGLYKVSNNANTDSFNTQAIIEKTKNNDVNAAAAVTSALSDSFLDQANGIKNKVSKLTYDNDNTISDYNNFLKDVTNISVNYLDKTAMVATVFGITNYITNKTIGSDKKSSAKFGKHNKGAVGDLAKKTVNGVSSVAVDVFKFNLAVVFYSSLSQALLLNMPDMIVIFFKIMFINLLSVIKYCLPIAIVGLIFSSTSSSEIAEKTKKIMVKLLEPYVLLFTMILSILAGYIALNASLGLIPISTNMINIMFASNGTIIGIVLSVFISLLLVVFLVYVFAKNSFQEVLKRMTVFDLSKSKAIDNVLTATEVTEGAEKALVLNSVRESKNLMNVIDRTSHVNRNKL